MITYHEIRNFLRQMQVLASSTKQLGEVLLPVVQLSEKIDQLNRELMQEESRMTHKIRSVEVLEDVIRKHIYKVVDQELLENDPLTADDAKDRQPWKDSDSSECSTEKRPRGAADVLAGKKNHEVP